MNKMLFKFGKTVLAMNLVVIMTPQLFADDRFNKPGGARGGGGRGQQQSQPQRQEAPRQMPRQEAPRQQERPPQRQPPVQQQRPAQQLPSQQPRQEQPVQKPLRPDQNWNQRPGGGQNQNPSQGQQQRAPEWSRGQAQQNIDSARQREQNWRNNSGASGRVTAASNNYYSRYNSVIVNRTTYINNYYNQPDYRYRYNSYFNYGFRSGYYYPVRPCYEINIYFNYPVLYWMYVSTVDVDYYRSWYNNDYYSYPVSEFQYARVYYPSETIRDLGMEVSAMPSRNQAYFRTALVNLTQALAQQIANNINYYFRLAENDIVVTNYQNLNNQAIVMEGFVDRDGIHAGFKALLDLNDPSRTLVFVPVNNYPTEAEQYTLRVINDRIYYLGGNPY